MSNKTSIDAATRATRRVNYGTIDSNAGNLIPPPSQSSTDNLSHQSPNLIEQTSDQIQTNLLTSNDQLPITSQRITRPKSPANDSTKETPTWSRTLNYFRTRNFWIILGLGQFLAIAITGTNTFTTLLVVEGASIPTFQTLFNYLLLNFVYTGYTIYRYGWKKWWRLVVNDGWKYMILSLLDVEGNYFTVLAYRYTTILSAQLINFWAIVVVVTISSTFLKVRYHWAQYLGILICVGGMGILLSSDHFSGVDDDNQERILNSNGNNNHNQLKGDIFALIGSTCYGLSNIYESYLINHTDLPIYEMLGQLSLYAIPINALQSLLFDRQAFLSTKFTPQVLTYLTFYTLILSLFYSLVPIMYRLSKNAAFLNISLLTGNFWGAVIGMMVFGFRITWLYVGAFGLVMVGQVVYWGGRGDAGGFGDCKAKRLEKRWVDEDEGEGGGQAVDEDVSVSESESVDGDGV